MVGKQLCIKTDHSRPLVSLLSSTHLDNHSPRVSSFWLYLMYFDYDAVHAREMLAYSIIVSMALSYAGSNALQEEVILSVSWAFKCLPAMEGMLPNY